MPYPGAVAGASPKVGGLDDPVWEQQAGAAAPPKTTRRSRHPGLRLALVGAVLAVLAGAVAFRLSRPGRQPGDPGGHILQQLQPVTGAIPPTATVESTHFDEPLWDSWDGRAGTFGWSDVVAQIGFSWAGTPSALMAYAGTEMMRRGWGPDMPTFENGVVGASWTKVLVNGTVARAQLGIEPGGSSWMLVAQAPPLRPRVS